MSDNRQRLSTLELISPEARGIALIALIAEVTILAMTPQLPTQQRIVALLVLAGLLLATLLGLLYIKRISEAKLRDHNQPLFERKVETLKNTLVSERFVPHLIIALPRGGLAVAGLLAKRLKIKDMPLLVLNRSSSIDDRFNCLEFIRDDFAQHVDEGQRVNVLIVDDILVSGHTLHDAKCRIEESTDRHEFVVKTAAITYYPGYDPRMKPDFVAESSNQPIRDVAGEIEPMSD